MVEKSSRHTAEATGLDGLAGLSRLAITSYENLERELRDRIEALEVQVRRFETAIDNITQGICFFDADERLILCNRRYAEIYRIALDRLQPGVTLADIVKLRLAAGTSPMADDAYLAFARSINSGSEPANWTAELHDGRTV